MTDKEIFYSMLSREIDNIFAVNPSLSFLGGIAKKWVFKYIEPYIDLFMGEDGKIEADMASAFAKKEIENKINEFKLHFKEETSNNE